MSRRRFAPLLLLLALVLLLPRIWHATAQTAVTYTPGWNLVAGPSGSHLNGAVDPIYTLQPADTDYESFPADTALVGGQGYWAYFPNGGGIDFAPGTRTYSVRPPAHQFVMVGNPSATGDATVGGAEAVYLYSPSSGYQLTSVIPAGQGAWAAGLATITLTAAPPPTPASPTPSPSPTPTPIPACSPSRLVVGVPGQDCRITGQNTPTARCLDGTFDYSRTITACGGHGGVAYWTPVLPGEAVDGADGAIGVGTASATPGSGGSSALAPTVAPSGSASGGSGSTTVSGAPTGTATPTPRPVSGSATATASTTPAPR